MESLAPTQELPSWLSYSTTIFTDTNGYGYSTSATLLQLPLTYYGPSIPLGTDGAWVYGGPTSPASSVIPSTTSESASLSTTSVEISAPPSSATPPPSSSSSISSLSSTDFTSSSEPSSSSLFSSTSSPPTATSNMSGSSHLGGSYIGAIVGSIVAAVVLLLLALLFLRCARRRRTRSGHDLLTPPPERHSRHSRTSVIALPTGEVGPDSDKPPRETIWTGWSMVHSNGSQTETSMPPGEGGWVHHDNTSGERLPGEGSPRGSGEEHDSFLKRSQYATSGEMAQANPSARLVNMSSIPSGIYSSTQGSADSTSTGASGYGTVVDPAVSRFTLNPPASQFGHILPPSVLLRMVEDSPREHHTIEEQDESGSPLVPPRPLDPDGIGYAYKQTPSLKSYGSLRYPDTPDSWDETAELMTATKVRVDEMGRAEAREVPSPTSESGPSGIFGGPLAAISRMSWFQRKPRPSESRPNSYLNRAHGDIDLETGQRPISGVSARSVESAGTVYHDAISRPTTPLLAQPPAALTHSRSRLGEEGPSVRVVDPDQPPPYDDYSILDTTSSTVRDPMDNSDVLDTPAPRPASPFTASSTTTARTTGPTFPPGLGRMMSLSTLGGGAGISIEVLEEEPPAAAAPWRSMTSGSDPDRRLTFGAPPVYIQPRDVTHSEQGSLNSMRSHLSPRAASRASGSAPASFISHTPDSSMGTTSSRHTRRTGASSGPSLAHSGSVSSDGRQGMRRPSDGPPTANSFGRLSVGATGNGAPRLHSPPPLSPLASGFGDTLTSITGSDITTEAVDPVTGTRLQLPRATMGRSHGPWAANISD